MDNAFEELSADLSMPHFLHRSQALTPAQILATDTKIIISLLLSSPADQYDRDDSTYTTHFEWAIGTVGEAYFEDRPLGGEVLRFDLPFHQQLVTGDWSPGESKE